MKNGRLSAAELRFAALVWEDGPLGSGELVRLCSARFGWKKSTTYTVLKNLCRRGVLQNEGAVVTALLSREAYERQQSEAFLEDAFGGSLPRFLAAFMGGRKLSAQQAQELKALIDRHREG